MSWCLLLVKLLLLFYWRLSSGIYTPPSPNSGCTFSLFEIFLCLTAPCNLYMHTRWIIEVELYYVSNFIVERIFLWIILKSSRTDLKFCLLTMRRQEYPIHLITKIYKCKLSLKLFIKTWQSCRDITSSVERYRMLIERG